MLVTLEIRCSNTARNVFNVCPSEPKQHNTVSCASSPHPGLAHAGGSQDVGSASPHRSATLQPHNLSNTVPSSISLASPKNGAFRTEYSGSFGSANTPAHPSGGANGGEAHDGTSSQANSNNAFATSATTAAGHAAGPSSAVTAGAAENASASGGTDSSPDVPYTPSNAPGSESVADSTIWVNNTTAVATASEVPPASAGINAAPSFQANMVNTDTVSEASHARSSQSGNSDQADVQHRMYDRKNTFSFGKSAHRTTHVIADGFGKTTREEETASLSMATGAFGAMPGELPEFDSTTEGALSMTLAADNRTPSSHAQPNQNVPSAHASSHRRTGSALAHPQAPETLSELSSSSVASPSITDTLSLPKDRKQPPSSLAQSPAEQHPLPHAAAAAVASPSSITSSSAPPRKSPSFSNLPSFSQAYANADSASAQALSPNPSMHGNPHSTSALEEASQASLQRVDTSTSFRTAGSGSSSFLNIDQYSSLMTLPRVPSIVTNANIPQSASAAIASAMNTPHSASASMHTTHSMQSMPGTFHTSQYGSQFSSQQQLYAHPGLHPPSHVTVVFPQSPEASQLASPEIMHEDKEETAAESLLADMQLQVCFRWVFIVKGVNISNTLQ